MKKKLLMVCYGGGHVTIIEPLYQQLKDKYEITVLALTLAAPYLAARGVPYVTFRSFKELFDPEVVTTGEGLLANLEHNGEVQYEDSLYYMGCSYYDLVESVGLEEAKSLYESKGRAAFYPEPTLIKIIQSLSPDMLITTNAIRAERASLSAAKKCGVPTLCINDGLWIEGGLSGVLDIANDELADIICVLSSEVKSNLEASRKSRSARIVATGTPVFDSIKLTERRKKTNQLTLLFADCHLPKHFHLYPDIVGDPEFAFRVREKLNVLAQEHDWKVIVRPHPNQVIDYSDYSNLHVSGKNDSLHEQLAQSDIVLTNMSTVGLEGKAMGLGLVTLEGTVFNRYNSFYKAGLSTPVFHESELYNAIIEELERATHGISLYEGLATENISREISRYLGS
ncbi:hypothetical protein DLH88_10535 [Vibrio parahaemolyticus]|uniref:Capsule polysaccharide biosynthesis protein n=2 Tax=Vibrio parahaemolyticus TaxID=670 RepID=A0AAW3IR45_VIBPH|nr:MULTISPECIES: hypothetical protein [Vibrio]KIT58076.1 hypothetical protein H334_00845 [Vibrio parahaemolyticus 901128]MDW2258614.1 hypothetical protein [Vibrio sp. 1409]AWG80028.1 hypothetical protein C9I78_15085 [Vibrio parahaemolyticus]AWJ79656.1 hypothetical protein C7Y67_15200 [Vibrio parahaemolyticus]EGQ8944044.1 hypothetical protein [Vibrio parahaemolyticus]